MVPYQRAVDPIHIAKENGAKTILKRQGKDRHMINFKMLTIAMELSKNDSLKAQFLKLFFSGLVKENVRKTPLSYS